MKPSEEAVREQTVPYRTPPSHTRPDEAMTNGAVPSLTPPDVALVRGGTKPNDTEQERTWPYHTVPYPTR